MNQNLAYHSNDFCVVGISYKNTDAVTRSGFSITPEKYEDIIKVAPSFGVNYLFILSTCNRCEFYSIAKDASALRQLFLSTVKDEEKSIEHVLYQKNSFEAMEHLYEVGCGLDSQILGDYEIVSQLKQAIGFSRGKNFLGPILERLTSSVLQSSKRIKTDTKLSDGSVSVAFAAAKFIKDQVAYADKKILVLGVGKIGRSVCKNLLTYISTENVTVANRSAAKAIAFAEELNLNYCATDSLNDTMDNFDIIIAATNSSEPVILASHFYEGVKRKTIIDLSIPCNIQSEVQNINGIQVVHLDEISKTKDESLNMRTNEIPKAKAIIQIHMQEFLQWEQKQRMRVIAQSPRSSSKEISQLTA